MRLMRKRQYDLLIRDAENRGSQEMTATIRDFLKHADKVYLEPVTGHVGSVTNSLFLIAEGGTALTILPEPKIADEDECLCTFRYMGMSNPPNPAWDTNPDCPIHKDIGPVWYGGHDGKPI